MIDTPLRGGFQVRQRIEHAEVLAESTFAVCVLRGPSMLEAEQDGSSRPVRHARWHGSTMGLGAW
jgi:hypothetical protein